MQGEPDNRLDFTSLPEAHEFPQALTSRIQSISTTVFSLPRFDLETLISMSPYREYNLRIEKQISRRSRDKSIAEGEHSDSEETPKKGCETKMKRRSVLESRRLSVIFIPEPSALVKSQARRGKSSKVSSSLKKRLSFENEVADSRNVAGFQVQENCRHRKQDGVKGSTSSRKQIGKQSHCSNDGVRPLVHQSRIKEQSQSSNDGVIPLLQHHQSKEQSQCTKVQSRSCGDGTRPLAGRQSQEIGGDRKEEYRFWQGKDGAFCGRHIEANKVSSQDEQGKSAVGGRDRNSIDVDRNGGELNSNEFSRSEKNGNDVITVRDHKIDDGSLHHKTGLDIKLSSGEKFSNGASHAKGFHIGDEESSHIKNDFFHEFKDGIDENSNGLCEKKSSFNEREDQFYGFSENGFKNRTRSEGSPLLYENIPDQVYRPSENGKNHAQNQDGMERYNLGSFDNNDVFADSSSCHKNGDNRLAEKSRIANSGLSLSEQIASSSENSFDSDASEGGLTKVKDGNSKKEKERMIYERSQSSRCLSEIEVHKKNQERVSLLVFIETNDL